MRSFQSMFLDIWKSYFLEKLSIFWMAVNIVIYIRPILPFYTHSVHPTSPPRGGWTSNQMFKEAVGGGEGVAWQDLNF